MLRDNLETKCVHLPDHGGEADVLGSLTPPIFQTSTFTFDTAEQGGARFAGAESGYIYTRLKNPTVRLLEEAIAELEGAEEGLAFASGMAAISAVLLGLVRSNNHILVSRGIYGSTYGFLSTLKERFHVDFSLAPLRTEEEVRASVTPSTRVIYVETPGNPTMELVDIAACARVAREIGAAVVVDNTFATPILQNPIALGADIVVHSATKYLSGHGDVVLGLAAGPKAILEDIRKTTQRDMGGVAAPFDSWLVMRGMKTLFLRMKQHCANALDIARRLEEHPGIEHVYYPGLATFHQAPLYQRQMHGAGGVVSFVVRGTFAQTTGMMNALQLCKRAVSLGDVHTLIQHPASMTHAGIPRDVRHKAGIDDGLVRLSVGLEHVDDIWRDLEQGLERAVNFADAEG